ncbi:tectonin beta-propeller repeat-containing protein 2 isoform X1 [Lampetra planeri]
MASPEAMALRECGPLYAVTNALPARVSRGLRSVPLRLSVLDASSEYLALGTNVGQVFLYCRRRHRLQKLDVKYDPITAVRLLTCLDDLVAVGTATGRVVLFQLTSPLPGRNKQLHRFEVAGQHSVSVVALAWSTNGMKLFSGDERGKVVCTSIDFELGVCNSFLVHEECSGVVQLDYAQRTLLVSTGQRSVLCFPETGQAARQVGTKPRKCTEPLGACFIPGLCKPADLTLHAARPGLRLWRADMAGAVKATYIFRDVLALDPRPVQLTARPTVAAGGGGSAGERAFGLLRPFLPTQGLLMSWSPSGLYVLDPTKQAVVGSLELGAGDLVAAACCNDEVFLLLGERELVRLSAQLQGTPEPAVPLTERGVGPGVPAADTTTALPSAPYGGSPVPTARPDTPPTIASPSTGPDDRPAAMATSPGSGSGTAFATEQRAGDGADVAVEGATSTAHAPNAPAPDAGPADGLAAEPVSEVGSGVAAREPLPEQRLRSLSLGELEEEGGRVLAEPLRRRKKKRHEGSGSLVEDSSAPLTQENPSSTTLPPAHVSAGACAVPDSVPEAPIADLQSDGNSASSGVNSAGAVSVAAVPQERVSTKSSLPEAVGSKPRTDACREGHTGRGAAERHGPMSLHDELRELGECEETPWTLHLTALAAGHSENISDEMADVDVSSSLPKPAVDVNKEWTSLSKVPQEDLVKQHRSDAPSPLIFLDKDKSDTRGTLLGAPGVAAGVSRSLDHPRQQRSPGTGVDKGRSGSVTLADDGSLAWLLGDEAPPRHDEATGSVAPQGSGYFGETVPAAFLVDDQHWWKKLTATHEGGNGEPRCQQEEEARREEEAEPAARGDGSDESDGEDIYARWAPASSSDTSVADAEGTVPGDAESPDEVAGGGSSTSSGSACEGRQAAGGSTPSVSRDGQLSECWMRHAGPGSLAAGLAVSERHLWCVDGRGVLHCAPVAPAPAGLLWQKYEEGVRHVAVSPSGMLLWKVEHKSGKAFAASKATMRGKRHWYEALTHVSHVALGDDSAWVVNVSGHLSVQTGLSGERPCARPVPVNNSPPLLQVAARAGVVWGITSQPNATLMCREGVSSLCPEGERWVIEQACVQQGLEVVCIALGDDHTGWVLDAQGRLWFRTGVTSQTPAGEGDHWWQVCLSEYVLCEPPSILQSLTAAVAAAGVAAAAPVEMLAERLRAVQRLRAPPAVGAHQAPLLAVGRSGVWVLSGRNEIHVSRGDLTGAYWASVVPRGTASTCIWLSVLVSPCPVDCGPGHSVWAMQNGGELFMFSFEPPDARGRLEPAGWPIVVPLPQPPVQLSVAHDAVWALDVAGRVFVRPLSRSVPAGAVWFPLDLSQLGSTRLVSVACGGQNVWACDAAGTVYFRMGTQPLNSSQMMPAWVALDRDTQNFQLCKLFCSPSDAMVWAMDARGNVFVRVGISHTMPIGCSWEHVPGLNATALALSEHTAWVLCPGGEVARRYGVREGNAAGDYWKRIPGQLSSLTVTGADEVWGCTPEGALVRRLTRPLRRSTGAAAPPHAYRLGSTDDNDDDWELL